MRTFVDRLASASLAPLLPDGGGNFACPSACLPPRCPAEVDVFTRNCVKSIEGEQAARGAAARCWLRAPGAERTSVAKSVSRVASDRKSIIYCLLYHVKTFQGACFFPLLSHKLHFDQ